MQQSRCAQVNVDEPTPTETVVSVSPSNSEGNTLLLQTATVWIDAPNQSQIAKCLLDGGSQRSFIREDISRALGLPIVGTEVIVTYIWLCNSQKSDIKKGQDNSEKLKNE